MRSLVVCIFFLQSSIALAEKLADHNYANIDTYEQAYSLFEAPPSSGIELALDSTKSIQSSTLKLMLTHSKSLFKPALFQKQNRIALHYLHVGKNFPLSFSDNISIYHGAGLTYFDSKNGYYSDEASLSFSLGIQSEYILPNNMSIRLDSKLFGTYFDGEYNQYCVEGACQLNQSNEFWIQKQISLKMEYSF